MSRQTYHIARGGKPLYQLDTPNLISRVQSGLLKPDDLYWTQGMSTWQKLSSMPALGPYWSANSPSAFAAPQVVHASAPKVVPAGKDGGPSCCPNCGNKNVKAARHLYLVGTRDSTTTGGSVGWGKNSNPRTWVSSRTSASRLAADLAPPEKNSGCGCLLVPLAFLMPIGLGAAISSKSGSPVAFGIMALLGLLVGVFLASKAVKYASEADKKAEQDYQQQMAEWERLWYCNKCSERFLW